MTKDLPPERDRRMDAETGMRHLREIMDIRHQQTTDGFRELREHNRVQDQEVEKLGQMLGGEIKAIRSELWLGLKWAGGLLSATILSVMLKALGLI